MSMETLGSPSAPRGAGSETESSRARDLVDECIVRRAARISLGGATSAGSVRRLAFLVFDSNDDIALVGSRSAALRPRRMLFQSGPAALDLELRTDRRGSHASLLGQLRGAVCVTGARIRLDGGNGAREADIDEQGWFELDAVRVGSYSATVVMDETSLEVPSLVI